MKAENTTISYDMTYMFSELKSCSACLTFRKSSDPTNCKLSYLHGLGDLRYIRNNSEKLEVINFLLKKCKGCVIINTTQESIYNFISENFPVYYRNEVPIGYGNGMQYHICIKNTINANSNCRQPIRVLNDLPTTENIHNKLLSILKKYRRKTDYVDEFIKSL